MLAYSVDPMVNDLWDFSTIPSYKEITAEGQPMKSYNSNDGRLRSRPARLPLFPTFIGEKFREKDPVEMGRLFFNSL
jgi:hypothetical protein